MNRKILLVAAVLFLGTASLRAGEGDFSFGLNVGDAVMLGSDMSQYGTSGFGFGGFFVFAPSDMFDVNVDLIYSPHGKGGNEANAIYCTVDLRMLLRFDQLYPYIAGGAGFYRNSVKLGASEGSATSFGFNIGLGFDVKLGNRFVLGIITKYHPVFDKDLAGGVPAMRDFWDAMLRFGVNFSTGIDSGWE